VTFLFTDIEGSTRRWESDAAAMQAALLAHDDALRTAIEAHDGFLFSHTGDGVVAAFASPLSAVTAPIDAHRELQLPVRMEAVAAHRLARRASGSPDRRRRDFPIRMSTYRRGCNFRLPSRPPIESGCYDAIRANGHPVNTN
jgi:class 3 adenylate cyclase